MKNNNQDEKEFTLTFKKTEIGILKAAMQLYELNQEFGAGNWMASGGGWSRYDTYICHQSDHILASLRNISNIEPDLGLGVEIEDLGKMFKKEIEKTQKQTNERNFKGYVEWLEQENAELKKLQKKNE